jgi:MFS family permease
MMLHGRVEEAEKLVRGIEAEVQKRSSIRDLPVPEKSIEIRRRDAIGFMTITRTMFRKFPQAFNTQLRTHGHTGLRLQCDSLHTHTVTLTKFFEMRSETAALFMLPFGLSNFVGTLVLGRLFDTIGRRSMIATTYTVAAAGFAATAFLFGRGLVSAHVFVALVCVAFFFASPAASAAYLTVSEIFPLEIRAMAIAFFYAIATGIGGAAGPAVFGKFLESQDRGGLMIGYLIAVGLMAAAAVIELVISVKAERQSLEAIASPLSAENEVAG